MLTTLLASSAVAFSPVLAQFGGGLVGIAILFFVIALAAWILGARGLAGMSAEIGRTLLFVFLVLAVITLIVSFAHSA